MILLYYSITHVYTHFICLCQLQAHLEETSFRFGGLYWVWVLSARFNKTRRVPVLWTVGYIPDCQRCDGCLQVFVHCDIFSVLRMLVASTCCEAYSMMATNSIYPVIVYANMFMQSSFLEVFVIYTFKSFIFIFTLCYVPNSYFLCKVWSPTAD